MKIGEQAFFFKKCTEKNENYSGPLKKVNLHINENWWKFCNSVHVGVCVSVSAPVCVCVCTIQCISENKAGSDF